MRFEDIPLRRVVDETDLSDLTTAKRTDESYMDPTTDIPVVVVPMDREPPADEAVAIRRRLVTVDAADEAHLYDLLAAYNDPTAPAWAKTILAGELAKYGETV